MIKTVIMGDILKWILRLNPIGTIWNNGKALSNLLFGTNFNNTYRDIGHLLSGSYHPSGVETGFPELDASISNGVQSFWNKETGAGLTEAERQQNEWTAQREDSYFTRMVSDMQNAGLNTALMYGNGASGPGVNTSAGGASSSGGISDLLQLAMLPLQIKATKAQIDKTKADTANVNANTQGTLLSNEWINREKQAEVDSKNSVASLNEKRESEIEQKIKESQQNIQESISRTHEIEERTRLEVSQRILNNANAKKIEALLPYEKLLLEAKTDNEKASAEQAFMHAAYENALINTGVVEFTAQKLNAEATVADIKAAISNPEFKPWLLSSDNPQLDKVCRTLISGLRGAIMTISGK